MVDYSLYVVTDHRIYFDEILKITESSILGGATIIQYRDKNSSFDAMIKHIKRLHKITQKYKIPLIINDNVKVMLATNAEGVHVGQDDMSAKQLRKMIGQDKILGVSAGSTKEALEALEDGADYLGVGPVFTTSTKLDAGEPIGLNGLKEISEIINIPIVAIGGINETNASQVINSGADGIAVISAVFGNPDPENAAKNIKNIIKKCKK